MVNVPMVVTCSDIVVPYLWIRVQGIMGTGTRPSGAQHQIFAFPITNMKSAESGEAKFFSVLWTDRKIMYGVVDTDLADAIQIYDPPGRGFRGSRQVSLVSEPGPLRGQHVM